MEIKKAMFSSFAFDPKLGLKDYSLLDIPNSIRLKNILSNGAIETDIKSGRTPSKFKDDYWNGDIDFLTLQDVDTLTFTIKPECTDKITETAIEEDKSLFQAPTNSLIVSNAMTVGLAFITDRPIYLNQNAFYLNINETKYHILFLKWYFNLVLRPAFNKIFTSKYLSKEEFGRLKLPNLSIKKQNEIAAIISIIESQILNLQSQTQDPLAMINKVFAEEFDYNPTLWKKFGKGMTAGTQKSNTKTFKYFSIPFNQIQTTIIFRFSSRFHNPTTQELTKILKRYSTVKVGKIITEKVHRGVQPKFEPEGEVYAIKTGQLKNGYIDLSECEMVSQEFYQNNKSAKVREGDILIASTGKVSLGKIDLIEFESNAIVDGHVSIVRLDERQYNKLFFTYFFRSVLGTFQVERDFTGTTNQIELYADQIEAFDIPDISLKKQESIVEKIKSELDKQKEIERQIGKKQKEISRIIETAIKG